MAPKAPAMARRPRRPPPIVGGGLPARRSHAYSIISADDAPHSQDWAAKMAAPPSGLLRPGWGRASVAACFNTALRIPLCASPSGAQEFVARRHVLAAQSASAPHFSCLGAAYVIRCVDTCSARNVKAFPVWCIAWAEATRPAARRTHMNVERSPTLNGWGWIIFHMVLRLAPHSQNFIGGKGPRRIPKPAMVATLELNEVT